MQRKAAFLLSTAIAVLSFKSVAIADFTATPMPVFVSQPNIEYVEYLPTRPKDAGDLRVAVAIYESYDFVKSLAPAMLIHVRDPKTGAKRLVLLAEHTTLDGKPLTCSGRTLIGKALFCTAIPQSVLPEGTKIVILYWTESMGTGTDTIVTVPK